MASISAVLPATAAYGTPDGCRLAAVVLTSHADADACAGRPATLCKESREVSSSDPGQPRQHPRRCPRRRSRPRLTLMLTVSCEATPAARAVSGLRAMGPLPLQRGEQGELRSASLSTHYPHASCTLIFKSTWDLTGTPSAPAIAIPYCAALPSVCPAPEPISPRET